jgi:hypothetical protein
MNLVKVAYAQHLPEAELIQSFLRDEGIPCMARRAAGFDVPDFLAAGPREILVAAENEEWARRVLDGWRPPGDDDGPIGGQTDEDPADDEADQSGGDGSALTKL